MAERREGTVRPPRAYAFPLATFHVCLLVLTFIVLGYPDLGGIAELNTVIGLLAFAMLWAVSYYGTAWALQDVRVHAVDVAMRRGIGGGARSGMLLVLAGLLPVVVLGSVSSPLMALAFAVIYGTIGMLVAAVVGGAIGFAFSLLDWAILALAGLGDGWRPPRGGEGREDKRSE